MTRAEKRAAAGLAAIFGLRMLGMFLILPVFALYAEHLPGGDNHTLVGLALGMYGLTQAILMIPFGMASDRIGRKKVIIFGLIVFALGSFLAATATDMRIRQASMATSRSRSKGDSRSDRNRRCEWRS